MKPQKIQFRFGIKKFLINNNNNKSQNGFKCPKMKENKIMNIYMDK